MNPLAPALANAALSRPGDTGGGSRSAAARVFDRLLEQILKVELKPFERVSEETLAETFEVSRTPVREALARLARMGLIDIYPQRGSIIAPLRLADLRKSQFLREALEVELMLRALDRDDHDALVTALRNEITVQEAFAAIADDRRFYQSDETLHRLIAVHAGFPGIWADISVAKLHMDRFRSLSFPQLDGMEIVLAQHREIVAAIAAHDRAGAEAVMRKHLRRIFEVVDLVRARFPDCFDPNEEDTPV